MQSYEEKMKKLEAKKQKYISIIRHCLNMEKVAFDEVFAETGSVYFTAHDNVWNRKVVIRLSDHDSRKIPKKGTASVCTIRYDTMGLSQNDKDYIKKCISKKIHKSPFCIRDRMWEDITCRSSAVASNNFVV